MPTKKLAAAMASAAVVVGSYVIFEKTRASFQPRIDDYVKATAAVAVGIIFPQPTPVEWKSVNREILDAANPKPEVEGVNRALEEYGVDLTNKALALFLIQLQLRVDPFDPGADLAAERLISHAFGEEHVNVINEAAANPELDEEALAQIRRQAAAAKVGETAHFIYGAVKASFSYGAVLEDDLGMGSYNEAVTALHEEAIEVLARTEEERLVSVQPSIGIAATKNMRQLLHALKEEPEMSPEAREEPPKLR